MRGMVEVERTQANGVEQQLAHERGDVQGSGLTGKHAERRDEVVMDRFTISRVGHLIFFRDPSGNVIGAMEHDTEAE